MEESVLAFVCFLFVVFCPFGLMAEDQPGFVLACGSPESGDQEFEYNWGDATSSAGDVTIGDTNSHRIQTFAHPNDGLTYGGCENPMDDDPDLSSRQRTFDILPGRGGQCRRSRQEQQRPLEATMPSRDSREHLIRPDVRRDLRP